MTLDLPSVRAHFPALSRPTVFLDNPGGTQVARQSLDRIQRYLVETNANHGGVFQTSRDSDAVVDEARAAAADFLNAASADEIIFGPNMTTLTFSMSRALGRMLQPGDTLVVTQLDHDANISPWLLLAEDRGCRVRWVRFNTEDCTWDMEDMQAAMQEKPRIVACGYSSNAVGTINPVANVVQMAHEVGALVYVDAVQYAPHGPIDVQTLGADFLACSAYKFFGPHMGILYGRLDLLKDLRAYRVRPAPADPPGKFETGTGNFEGMAGVLGALEYFEWLGQTYGADFAELYRDSYSGRRLTLKEGMAAMRAYEHELSRALLSTLQAVPGLRLYGIGDPRRIDERVPTFSFTMEGWTPRQIAESLAARAINVWNGNFYALAVTTALGLEEQGGMLRVGAAHYNTLQEVALLGQALNDLAHTRPA